MYKTLDKIFYSDKSNNKKDYHDCVRERINSDSTTFLDFMISENQAFFTLTPELLMDISEVYRIDKSIRILEEQLPEKALAQFSQRCLIDEIVLTNKIEGVHSTRKEIGKILYELEQKDEKKRFRGLVKKYIMLNRNEELPLKTCEDIRIIYDELVLPEIMEEHKDNIPDGNIFRKGSVSVYSDTQKELHQGLYPETKICSAIEQALVVLERDDIEPLIRISIFHYLIGYIHPFYDGNGRLSRFISSYLLAKILEPLIGYRISYTIQEHIKDYYKAFTICNSPLDKGDITPFVNMFIGVIKEAIHQLRAALEKRRDDLNYYTNNIDLLPYSDEQKCNHLYQLLIQASLFSEYGTSIKEILNNMDISRTTFARLLKKVESCGFVISHSLDREKFFYLDLDSFNDQISARI